MRWLRENRAVAAFAAVLLLLAADSAVTFFGLTAATRFQEPAIQRLHSLRVIDAVRTALIDAETGQRGYIITGDPAYLEPYYAAVTSLRRELDLLRLAAGADGPHTSELAELEPLITTKIEELNNTIVLRRTRGMDAARQVVAGGAGKRTMDAIRLLLTRMEERINGSLLEASRDAALHSRMTLVPFGIGTGLMLALCFALFHLLARDVRRQRHSEAVLKDAHDRLASSVRAMEQRNRQVVLISEMSGALQSCVNMEEALLVTAKFCQQLFPDRVGVLYFMHPSRNYLDVAAAWGGAHHSGSVLAPEDCWALRRGEPYEVHALLPQPPCRHVDAAKVASYLCVPLQAQGELLGLLHFEGADPDADEELQRRARQMALGTGKQVALALANIRLRDILRRQSVRDPLTGLFNRRYLEETLQRDVARAARDNGSFCVVMLDVDHFKRFNDDFGHEAGDLVLREIGALLRAQTRAGDTACRYGGEEFVLVLADAEVEGARQRCEDLRRQAQALALSFRQQPLPAVTVSMGLAAFPRHGRSADELLRAADEALYRAKGAGRNRVELAGTANAG